MIDEIIEEYEFEQMLKDITLGGTEFRYRVKHKHISSDETESTRELS